MLAWVDPGFRKVGCVEWSLINFDSSSGKMTADDRGHASYLYEILPEALISTPAKPNYACTEIYRDITISVPEQLIFFFFRIF